MFVIVIGTMFGAKTIHGPFVNYEDASIWVYSLPYRRPFEIVPLKSPDYPPERLSIHANPDYV